MAASTPSQPRRRYTVRMRKHRVMARFSSLSRASRALGKNSGYLRDRLQSRALVLGRWESCGEWEVYVTMV